MPNEKTIITITIEHQSGKQGDDSFGKDKRLENLETKGFKENSSGKEA